MIDLVATRNKVFAESDIMEKFLLIVVLPELNDDFNSKCSFALLAASKRLEVHRVEGNE